MIFVSEEQTLIERLEKATGPDRELDILIARAGFKHELVRWEVMTTDTDGSECPDGVLVWTTEREKPYHLSIDRYTSSLDAAMTLIEPGCEISLTNLYGVAMAEVGLNHNDGSEQARREDGNLALALVTAALKFKARAAP